MKAIKVIPTFCACALIPLTLVAQDFSNLKYRNIGPSRGGRVTAVAGTVVSPSTFFLGASGGGLWKTEDYGTSWYNVSDGYFETPSIGDISIAQNDANIIYVGTGSDGLRSNVIVGKGMYKSVDGGTTWKHIGLRNTGHIGAVEIDPTDHSTVWVAAIGQAFNPNAERGIYKTINGGKDWDQVLYISDTVGFSDIELLPGNPNIVFATAWKAERKPWTIISGGQQDEGGIYKSVDGGISWEKITQGLPSGLIGKIDLAIPASHSNIVYALVEAPDDAGGLYKSIDQGQTFSLVSNEESIRTRPFYYGNVDVHPHDADIVYVMATRNMKSSDGGISWERLRTPHGDNHDMWISPTNPDLFIQSNDGGANITHNGGKTWSTQFNQPTAELYQVEVDDQYPYWLYGGQQDNSTTIAIPSMPPFRAQDPAAWLVDAGGCETGPAVPKPGDHNIVYANCKGRFSVFDKRIGTEKGYYVGATNMYGHNPKDLEYRFQRVSPIHVSPHDPGIIYHASQYVHRTTDEGETWETISPDLTAFDESKQVISGSPITRDITGEEFYSTIYSLRESSVESGIIWSGANDGPVYRTLNHGEDWQEVTPRGLPPGGRVDAVEPSPHNPAKAYIAVHRYQLGDWKPYIYKTDDYGRRWKLLTTGSNGIPENFPTRVIREDPVREGLLFAGTEFGMFISLDDGKSWQRFQQNLAVTPVTDIKIVRGDLVLSTMGRSFWVLDNITALRQQPFETLDDRPILFAPKETIRYRNVYGRQSAHGVPDYPPPAVIIDYYLPPDQNSVVQLEILDEVGQVVNSYYSQLGDQNGSGVEHIENMALSQRELISRQILAGQSGMNRFHWDMTHLGAWSEKAEDIYARGPMVRPGNYIVRLRVGNELVAEQGLVLQMDPRLIAQGTTITDVDGQVAFSLMLVDLISEARKLKKQASDEQKDLEGRSAQLKPEDASRLLLVTETLKQLETADIIYPKPMLIDQISYLYNMVNKADQAPGVEAADRYTTLAKELAELKDQYSVRGN